MALQEEFESQGNFLFRYRGNLPLIIVFVGIFVFVFDKLYSVDGSCVPYSVIEYCSLAVSLLGLGIRIYTVGHTPETGRTTAETARHKNLHRGTHTGKYFGPKHETRPAGR